MSLELIISEIASELNIRLQSFTDLASKLSGIKELRINVHNTDKSIIKVLLNTFESISIDLKEDNLVLFSELRDELLSLLEGVILDGVEYIELYITREQTNEWHEEGSHIRAIIWQREVT